MTKNSFKDNLILASSYILWGFFPLYWHQLQHISAFEILLHRIIWSFVFFSLIYTFLFLRKKSKVKKTINPFKEISKRDLLRLLMSSALITANWFLYIYAINSHQVIQGSLAYYLSPLVSILFGSLFYSERISKIIQLAFFSCALGVLILLFQTKEWPWLSLVLAFTFSGYGLIKKKIRLHAVESALIESSFLIIPCIYFAFFSSLQTYEFFSSRDWIFLIIGGAVTGIPIALFSYSAQRVSMASIGFFQYISPTLQFLSAVFILNEAIKSEKLFAFLFIWIGAGIYLYSLKRKSFKPEADKL